MDEIVPGILHWTAFNERIGQTVHSYVHTASGAIFDPLLPAPVVLGSTTADDGTATAESTPGAAAGSTAKAAGSPAATDSGAPPEHDDRAALLLSDAVLPTVVLLSSRHHRRDAEAVASEYGIPIKVSEPGAHEFDGDDTPDVETFAFGEEVVAGVRAWTLPALAPDETVFRLDGDASGAPAALLFGDSLIRVDGELSFVPDSLMGDDPEAVRRGLIDGLTALLDDAAPFDTLLFAHGAPLATGGHAALAAFVADHAA